MSREAHVRICESARVKSPRATRPFVAAIDLGFRFVTRQKLRLRGLDAPEIVTEEGLEAKNFLEKLLLSGTVLVRAMKPDKYDRYLADVFVTDSRGISKYVNQEMIFRGLAYPVPEN